MIDIEFRIEGEKQSLNKELDEMVAKADAEARKYAQEYIQRKLAHVRCPEHGGAPRRVVVEGPSWEKLEFFLPDPCCEKLTDEAAKALE